MVLLLLQIKSEYHPSLILKPRRWLQRQQETFFSITPEERKLVEESVARWPQDESSKRDVRASS